MNKAELIEILTERLDTDRRQATNAVEHVVDIIVRAVHAGDSVTITGFGVFEQRRRAARVARNPRTGETVKVKPTSVPAFRPGAQFKAVIAGTQKLAADGPAVKRGVNAGPAKKTAAKKAAVKKAAAKKAAVKKTVAKKAAVKAPAKKAAVKKTVAKKAAVKKAVVKKTVAKKAPVKKAVAKKTVAKKAPVKKAVAKKAPAKKATRRK
ncbi:MAG: HU family DNA-binding protein [Mycobacteriaceae bacterium]